MTHEISNDYATEKRVIEHIPTIKIKSYRDASLWLKKARYVKTENSADFSTYYVASSQLNSEENFDIEYIQEINVVENYNSLDVYRKKRFAKFWTVILRKNAAWNTSSTCDCPSFLKNFQCKHIIGLALGNGICKLPKQALTTEIKKAVSKKGRAPKSTSALQKP